MKTNIAIIFSILVLVCACGEPQSCEGTYINPVMAGDYPDPSIIRDGNDYYLTITESKRRVERDGRFVYDKHKIFLYKEDFEKFSEGLAEVIEYIKQNCFHGEIPQRPAGSDVEFEDL